MYCANVFVRWQAVLHAIGLKGVLRCQPDVPAATLCGVDGVQITSGNGHLATPLSRMAVVPFLTTHTPSAGGGPANFLKSDFKSFQLQHQPFDSCTAGSRSADSWRLLHASQPHTAVCSMDPPERACCVQG